MPRDVQAHGGCMQALNELVDALGISEQFHHADLFYATVEPGDRKHLPLVLASWPGPTDAGATRSILVAHYFYAHGHLRPYPEFIVNDLGHLLWMRTRVECTRVHPDDTSRDYLLTMLAQDIHSHFLPQARLQQRVGRAGLHCVPQVDVQMIIDAYRHSELLTHSPTHEANPNRGAYLAAFEAFLSNREAVKASLIQSTAMALRDEPEHLYLVCEASGTWCTLSEGDLAQRLRWRQKNKAGGPSAVTFRLPSVTEQRKLQYSDLFQEATGTYGGFVTDRRTLLDLAHELDHAVHEFIEQEVAWYLNDLIDQLRDLKAWYKRCAGLDMDDDEGDCGSGVVL